MARNKTIKIDLRVGADDYRLIEKVQNEKGISRSAAIRLFLRGRRLCDLTDRCPFAGVVEGDVRELKAAYNNKNEEITIALPPSVGGKRLPRVTFIRQRK